MDTGDNNGVEIIKLLYEGEGSSAEKTLATSILYSRNLWDSQVKHVITGENGSNGLREWCLLQRVIAASSEAIFCKHYRQWTSLLAQALKTNQDEHIHHELCKGVCSLVGRSHHFSKDLPDFAKQKVSLLLQALLCSATSSPSMQLQAMRAAASCHAHFAAGQNQHRVALQKWAAAALFDPLIPLSLEGCRLMVLLCHNSNQKWSALVESALVNLEWSLDQLFSPNAKSTKPPHCSGVPVVEIPNLPSITEPQRTVELLTLVDHLTRALNMFLLVPPEDRGHLPSVPVEKILAVIIRGLGQRPLPGHTVECRVFVAGLPLLRTSLWNVLSVLLRTCHSHLLPYARLIRSVILEEIVSVEVRQSPLLLAAVYRTISLWVGVTRHYDQAFINPILQALLALADHTPSCCLQLQTLCDMVEVLGPAIEGSPWIPAIQQLPFVKIGAQTRCEEVLGYLRLLGACVRARGSLCPPLGPVLQLLTDVSRHHSDKQVQSTSCQILSQCNFLMHPSAPPLPPTAASLSSTSTAHCSVPFSSHHLNLPPNAATSPCAETENVCTPLSQPSSETCTSKPVTPSKPTDLAPGPSLADRIEVLMSQTRKRSIDKGIGASGPKSKKALVCDGSDSDTENGQTVASEITSAMCDLSQDKSGGLGRAPFDDQAPWDIGVEVDSPKSNHSADCMDAVGSSSEDEVTSGAELFVAESSSDESSDQNQD